MSARDESERAFAGRRALRFKRMRVPIAAALVFILLWALGALAPVPALVGYVLVAAASLLDHEARAPLPAARLNERTALPSGEAWLETVLAGAARSGDRA